eukprot:SAG11_NODE_1320_length_5208_cov_5.188687_3_plen_93_part_00
MPGGGDGGDGGGGDRAPVRPADRLSCAAPPPRASVTPRVAATVGVGSEPACAARELHRQLRCALSSTQRIRLGDLGCTGQTHQSVGRPRDER